MKSRTVTLVTGASQGIGAAIARAFAEAGVGALALVARNKRNLNRVAASCRKLGVRTRTQAALLLQQMESIPG